MSLAPKKSIDDADVKGKKVLIRVDFNVPIKNGEITNDFRIRSALPTIEKVLKEGGSCILMSHLGRPKGAKMSDPKPASGVRGFEEEASLKPVVDRLAQLLGKPVEFAPDCLDASKQAANLKPGEVLVLENVRFYSEEGSKNAADREAMAKVLASYGDLYVSDAFGTAHRDSATMTGIPKVLGTGYAGYLMEKEINYFAQVLNNPPRPLVAIVGGAKVSDKIQLLDNMLGRINYLIIGGAMAYTFLKAQCHAIGISRCEEDKLDLARSLLTKAHERNVEVLLPIDHVCNKEFKAVSTPLVTKNVDIPDGYMGLDIGPKTIAKYVEVIAKCKSAIWNGPMGVFEMDCYSKGTFAIAKAMGDGTQKHGLLSIIGGGDSASAAEKSNEASRMSHVSTGGGASLELLEGKTLPGVAVLTNKTKSLRPSSVASSYEVTSECYHCNSYCDCEIDSRAESSICKCSESCVCESFCDCDLDSRKSHSKCKCKPECFCAAAGVDANKKSCQCDPPCMCSSNTEKRIIRFGDRCYRKPLLALLLLLLAVVFGRKLARKLLS